MSKIKSNSKSAKKTILIMAGGTGGHIFPALAIANLLEKNNVKINWLGSKSGMENTLVPAKNIQFHAVSSVGLRGKSLLQLLRAPFLLGWAFLQTLLIFIKIRPAAVLGMGGFASGIGGVVAWILGIPLIIHEQNSIAGSTNKLLDKISTQTFQAFPKTFENAVTTGNPVVFSAAEKHSGSKLNLLILGGSLGSKPINDVAVRLQLDINIWHQTGKANYENVKAKYAKNSANSVKIEDFIDDMAAAYAWADVVLCRAGAMTVAELMLSASASILVPLPHAIDNHQFFNAKILADNAAGTLIQQKDLTLELLEKTIKTFNKTQIKQMSAAAKKLAKPNATKEISEYLLTFCQQK